MTKDLRTTTSLFTQVDISAGATLDRTASGGSPEGPRSSQRNAARASS